jgi:DHA1 family tetracycline resistance protein-like MFS transporter
LIFCFGWSFFDEFIPVTWIHDYNFDPGQIGFFFAYGAGFYALSSAILIRPIIKRFDNRSVFFYTLILLGTIFLALLSSPSVIWVWIYMPVINILIALIFPTSLTMVSDWAEKDSQGETLGILASVQAAAFALSPLAGGTLLSYHPHMPMFLGGISMFLAALILGIMLRKEIFSK